MKIKAEKREKLAKNHNARLRRLGKIPACLYASGMKTEHLSINLSDFEAILRQVNKGESSTMRFTLDIEGQSYETLIKGVQYEPTTYKPLHIDFIGINEKRKIKVNIPLRFKGAIDCIGVKLGGILRQVIKYVEVQCFPSQIPAFFEIDVSQLGLKQSKKVEDISLPQGVRLLTPPKEVTVTIAKR